MDSLTEDTSGSRVSTLTGLAMISVSLGRAVDELEVLLDEVQALVAAVAVIAAIARISRSWPRNAARGRGGPAGLVGVGIM